MAPIFRNIRTRGVGILADRDGRSDSLDLRRYNLIYGFNGSGKSTLSRLFASLQAGVQSAHLPADSSFEFELDDGTKYGAPGSLSGLERRVAVFNADFVEQNLQWAASRANPVFYIGREQANKAAELAEFEKEHPSVTQRVKDAKALLKSNEKVLANFKRDRARLIATELGLRNRKYEAPQLVKDFGSLALGPDAMLDAAGLDAARVTCRLDAPLPRQSVPTASIDEPESAAEHACTLLGQSPAVVVLDTLKQHPDMLVWVRQGHQYHIQSGLSDCLLCGGRFTQERQQVLAQVLDDRLNTFLAGIDAAIDRMQRVDGTMSALRSQVEAVVLTTELRSKHATVQQHLSQALLNWSRLSSLILNALREKQRKPTVRFERSGVATQGAIADAIAAVSNCLDDLKELVDSHNAVVGGFSQAQEEAQLAVRRHFLAESEEEFRGYQSGCDSAHDEVEASQKALAALEERMARLRSEIAEHGPAAQHINKLIQSYLGHAELSICAVEDGYEIQRHGRLIEGLPSEGEKTAIAICYFISTLEAQGRAIEDLIVVVDDPISSLDTKAMNFACALVKNRLSKAAQLIVLTHNQHCMSEFKKAWKSHYKPGDPSKERTATFLFLDVCVPQDKTSRCTKIVPMSRLLREYDFEYHFLFHYVLKFSASRDSDYEYAYMMPNILRRVLDVFLSFRYPGNSGFASKIDQLCTDHPTLNRDRLCALERLAQVESHSDSLDDLVTFSSMTLEEAQAANGTLLEMMQEVDPRHLTRLRKLCA
jgi:wobble nucleotide-excising tRNase